MIKSNQIQPEVNPKPSLIPKQTKKIIKQKTNPKPLLKRKLKK
jgi:hypothetical protein